LEEALTMGADHHDLGVERNELLDDRLCHVLALGDATFGLDASFPERTDERSRVLAELVGEVAIDQRVVTGPTPRGLM
jgi:hypothetical protein